MLQPLGCPSQPPMQIIVRSCSCSRQVSRGAEDSRVTIEMAAHAHNSCREDSPLCSLSPTLKTASEYSSQNVTCYKVKKKQRKQLYVTADGSFLPWDGRFWGMKRLASLPSGSLVSSEVQTDFALILLFEYQKHAGGMRPV